MTAIKPSPNLQAWYRTAVASMIAISASTATAAPHDTTPLVLVELFTSQGCSSCPPADSALARLSARPDVLPLAFHVDYWDDLGWKDTFSSHEFTVRQQRYAANRGFEIYTPQMIIEGRHDLVGSRDEQASRLIDHALLESNHVAANIDRHGDHLTVSLSALPASRRVAAANVLLVAFDPTDEVSIRSGENSGHTIRYSNVVRSIRRIGTWTGVANRFDTALNAGETTRSLAVVVQDSNEDVWAVAVVPAST